MTPAEKIAAAIEKLEALRAGISPGRWEVTHGEDGIAIEWDHHRDSVDSPYVARLSDDEGAEFNPDPGGADCDAYLIVTLHRTIDAQLAILRYGLGGADDVASGHYPDEPAGARLALALSDAILGES